MNRLSFLIFVTLSLTLRGTVAQPESDADVPAADLFAPDTPEGPIQYTVNFDLDQDDGAAETTSDFSSDNDPNDEAFGTLFLMSPNQAAMSDLSKSSDWVLTGCNPKGLQRQSVAAFCSKSMRATDSGCKHVFAGKAEHTIVKMPAGCGKGPLARVHSLEVHPDQDGALSREDLKRKPAAEPVYRLTFDYDFAAIPEDNGPVFMRGDVSDIPGYYDAIVESPTGPEELTRRAMSAKFQRRGWWSNFVNWVKKVTTVSKSSNQKRKFTWKDNFNLYNTSKDCPGPPEFHADLSIDVAGQADFSTAYGFYFEGSVVPPNVDKAFVYFNGDAAASATFTITGTASITYDSKRINIVTFGFPGLSVPGIVTVGPSLRLDGYISGGITLDGSITTGISYRFPPVNFAVGPGSNMQSTAVKPVSLPENSFMPVLTAGVAVSADAALHIVPSVQLGVSLLGGKLIDAQAYIEADLYAGIGLNASVSNTQAPTFCANPYFGVNLGAGVRGSVAFWEGQVGPYNFFEEKFDIASSCFSPSAQRAFAPRELDYSKHEIVGGPVKDAARGLSKRLSIPAAFNCPSKKGKKV